MLGAKKREMKQTDQIRELLDQIDATSATPDDQAFAKNFNSLELPDILCSVVDFLQPSLYPYEAAVYWHLFRKAILGNGTQYTRASVRGMMQGVVTSSSGQSDGLSYAAVQKALQGLEDKGAISKAGDTNREGTLYKVHLPEEIQSCQEKMKEAQQTEPAKIDTKRELDFYNVRENRLKVFERDGYKCHYCGKQLTRFNATLDHLQPVSEGGDNSFDNLATACLHCNSQRGSRPVMDIVTEKSSQQKNSPDKK
jgi:hypothetical protein